MWRLTVISDKWITTQTHHGTTKPAGIPLKKALVATGQSCCHWARGSTVAEREGSSQRCSPRTRLDKSKRSEFADGLQQPKDTTHKPRCFVNSALLLVLLLLLPMNPREPICFSCIHTAYTLRLQGRYTKQLFFASRVLPLQSCKVDA